MIIEIVRWCERDVAKKAENHPIRITVICWELLNHFLESFVQEIEAMASDCGMDIPGAKANDESGNTDAFDKIHSFFGEDIYASLQSKS